MHSPPTIGRSQPSCGEPFSTYSASPNYWLPHLRELLPSSLLEQVKKNAADHAIVKEILTEHELIVDTYEQVRERPGDKEEQEKYFSGKKSNHTFNTPDSF
ncbi:hypothetical protein QT978_32390 [Microcoleus sp. SVA1_B3]